MNEILRRENLYGERELLGQRSKKISELATEKYVYGFSVRKKMFTKKHQPTEKIVGKKLCMQKIVFLLPQKKRN